MSKSSNRDNKIKELTDSNIELENYFQSTIISQMFVDANLILRKYSPTVVKQFNLSKNDIGKSLVELVTNFKYDSINKDIEDSIRKKIILEKEIQSSDGKWYRMNVVPYFQREENTTNGVIITFVDINNYVIALKELQKLNLDHETFIYSVSHDLKGPLNNIQGLIKTLQEPDKNENLNQIIEMLDSSTKKMKDMITELTQISKEQGDDSEDVEKIEFDDLLKEVLLTLKDKIDESKAKIESDFEINELLIERKNLRSVLYNLISNSIKYSVPGRKPIIVIKTRMTEGYIALSVEDNGRGIEDDKKEAIFSKFSRVLRNVEGTGVGLYLIKKIIDNLGGKIEVESKVNEGSKFKVYFKA